MTLPELDAALRKLRLSGMADVLEAQLRQAQQERQAPIDILSALVGDELLRREDRLLARRLQQARFRDADRTLDTFDFGFTRKMPQALIHELATARFVAQREDALLLGPPGTGKSHLAPGARACRDPAGLPRGLSRSAILLEEITEASVEGTRKALMLELTTVPLLIIDDLGMRKLPHTAAEDLLEVIMRRYERASTLLTSNRPVDDWGKLLGDTAAVTALLDRLLHHAHVLKCGPRSWRTKVHTDLRPDPLPQSNSGRLDARQKWPVLTVDDMAGFDPSTEGQSFVSLHRWSGGQALKCSPHQHATAGNCILAMHSWGLPPPALGQVDRSSPDDAARALSVNCQSSGFAYGSDVRPVSTLNAPQTTSQLAQTSSTPTESDLND